MLWKPIWNILESYDFTLQLVNTRELKQVPGRKSDVKDSLWIAHLLACGLLRSNFVPQRGQRQLRDLTRHRPQLHGEHTRCANRIHKVLPDAHIKLSSLATDILGISGRKRNVWFRQALCESAWAARRSKDTYFQAQFHRLACRWGKKRAIVAEAYSLLVVFYHLLKDKSLKYNELGGDYFDTLAPNRLRHHLVKRLESLVYEVTLADRNAA